MSELTLKTEFDYLPEEIRVWLRSEAAAVIVDQLNTRYALVDDQQDAIPCIATWIPLLLLRPEKTIPSLLDDFAIPKETAPLLAKDIEHLLFAPIKLAMRQKLGVDVEKIAEMPKSPAQPTRPLMTDIRPAAKTTELQKSATGAEPIKVSIQAPAPKKPTYPGAGTLRTDKPIGLSEILPTPPKPHELEKYEDTHPVIE
jgi:hypothetical protein